MNKIIISGNLTKDVELKHIDGEKCVANFTIAVKNFRRKNTDFFDCVAWNQSARFLGQHARKGDPVIVTGSMNSEDYKDKDGNNRRSWKINADDVELYSKKNSENVGDSRADVGTNENTVTQNKSTTDVKDEELPF